MGDEPVAGGLDELELTGRAATHVIEVAELGCTLHPAAAPALARMRAAACAAGIELQAVSAFRDFARQRSLWNAKYRGERPLLGRRGELVVRAALPPDALVDTILLWSALPGASRHHWGCDIDVIDRAALPPGGAAQLVAAEFAPGGPFAALDRWLAENMAGFGFFRPYTRDRGGVQPEPWHLSFAPVSEPALAALTPTVLRGALENADLEGKPQVLARLEALHARYVAAVEPAPAGALAAGAPLLNSPTRLS